MPRHLHEVCSPDGTLEIMFGTNQEGLSRETKQALEDFALSAVIWLDEHGLLEDLG